MEENNNVTGNIESGKAEGDSAQAPKKKKIAIVFRPQNLKSDGSGRGSRSGGSSGRARTGGTAGKKEAPAAPAAEAQAQTSKTVKKPSSTIKAVPKPTETPEKKEPKTSKKKVEEAPAETVSAQKTEQAAVAAAAEASEALAAEAAKKEEAAPEKTEEKSAKTPAKTTKTKTAKTKAEKAEKDSQEKPAEEAAKPAEKVETESAPEKPAKTEKAEKKETPAEEKTVAPEPEKSAEKEAASTQDAQSGDKKTGQPVIKPDTGRTIVRPVPRRNIYAEMNSAKEAAGRTGSRDGRGDGSRDRAAGQGQRGGRDGGFRQGQGSGSRSQDSRQGGFSRSGEGRPDFAKDKDERDSRPGQGRGQGFGKGQGGRRDSRPSGGFDSTPAQAKPQDSRRPKDFERKAKEHGKKYDQPKNAENTRNLEKSYKNKRPQTPAPQPVEKKEDEIKTITLPEHMTIKELAEALKQQPAAIVKSLFMKGEIVTINSDITYEKAEEIALEYNCICEPEVKVDVIEELLKNSDVEDSEETLVKRAPVVCVMGHVDHGKTSLLDAIRSTNVTSREAGGITQHIGAYTVKCNGQDITFLDTPGHEAFTAMRMRGAMSTDIAILVVAADDGVMPQTVEAINHAKAAGVEIIVAINKIDKPGANIERVKQELTEYELVAEDWGGSTIFVPVSAKSHEGIDNLLEMILLAADVMELKANPKRKARGIVIEAELDKGRGPVATVLVQKGTLHVGDIIAIGSCYGKVRAMIDDKGRKVKEAGPSIPVEVLGLNDVPMSGDIVVTHANEKDARAFADTFIKQKREKLLDETRKNLTLDGLFDEIKAGNVKELNLILKADVQGSVEAVKTSLQKLSNEEVVVKVIHGGVGAVNESDVMLASASNAIIIGFNVRVEPAAKSSADREGVDLRLYRVIYQAIEDVEAAMKGMLDPVYEEKIIGHAEIRQIFKSSAVGMIAGSYVKDGVIQRGCSVRITREGEQIYEGPLSALKRFKDDVKEVKEGYECGMSFEKFNDLKEEDMIEAYIMVEMPR